MAAPTFVALLAIDGSTVEVNDFDNIAFLAPIPSQQLPPAILNGTFVQFNDRVLAVQGKVGAIAGLLTPLGGVSFVTFLELATGNSVAANVLENIAALTPIPASQLPSTVPDGTLIEFDGVTLAIRGAVAATLALIVAAPIPPGAPFAPIAAEFFGISGVAGAPDYAAPIAIGAPLPIPQDGPAVGGAAGVSRLGPDTFKFNTTGYYEVSYQGSFDEQGQLALAKNGALAGLDETRAGRATGTSQITNTFILNIDAGDTIQILNDASPAALTVTPTAGGTKPVVVSLSIKRVG